MDARSRSAPGRAYEDFEPLSDWIRETGSDTLILTLPGFKKEHLKVNLDNNRILKVSGERPLSNNRSSRFYKEVQIPDYCDVNDLRARIESGSLFITMPKTIRWEGVTERTAPTKESPRSQDTSERQYYEKDQTDERMKSTSNTTRDVTKKEATSTDAEKQMKEEETKKKATADETKKKEEETKKKATADETKKKEEETKKKATADETKKKEEEKKNDETRETYEGSTEMEANDGGLLKEGYMHGGGLLLGLDESRQLVMNVAIGLLVMLALLVYVIQKITS